KEKFLSGVRLVCFAGVLGAECYMVSDQEPDCTELYIDLGNGMAGQLILEISDDAANLRVQLRFGPTRFRCESCNRANSFVIQSKQFLNRLRVVPPVRFFV